VEAIVTEVMDASRTLMAKASELDELSKSMGNAELELAPLEIELIEWVEDYHVTCWTEHIEKDAKLPAESVRIALAHRSFDREKYQKILLLRTRRDRYKKRLTNLREVVDAQRSIVSALKTELEASQGPQPQWS
jgi:hypothetical protein